MNVSTRRIGTLLGAAALAIPLVACPSDKTAPPAVASVQITAVPTNPRVGEVVHISAAALNDGGVQIQGVVCTYSSGTAAVGTIDAGNGTFTAVSVGTTIVTATCGGKSNTVTMTVRPPLVTLTLNKTGTGTGSLFATPAGPTYDQGTSVSIAATAATGSTFTGFTGGGCGTTSPCTVTMNSDLTVSANFNPSETFTNTTSFGGAMSSVSDPSPPGCNYNVSVNATGLTFVLNATGGTGTVQSTINVAATGGSCTGTPFTETVAGNMTVSGSTVSGTLTHVGASGTADQTITISGTRSGNSITATANVAVVLKNNLGTSFNSSGGPYSVTLSKTP